MSGKREANYSTSDRIFDGVASMWLRKSAEEAPEVGTYNYDNVGEVEGWGANTTDLTDFNSQWSSTLFGEQIASKHGKSEQAKVDIDTLLNDVWFCVITEDTGKVVALLERARFQGVEYPSDYPMKNMFGDSSLWERIHDNDFKISGGTRDTMTRILTNYHRRDL